MNANTVVSLKQASIAQIDQVVLTEVNLNVTRGEFVYLIGKTGSGKSSLLKTLYGALPLQAGKGYVADFNLLDLNRKKIPLLRRKLGIVFQDFNLLSDRSVYENLLFVLKATAWKQQQAMDKRIEDVLTKVGMLAAKDKMPHTLSGGEQQRIVIARALLNKPELIIADEATGNLDPETSEEILVLIRELAIKENTAVLFATHDYRVIENFPARIIRCRDGKVIDEENFVV
ncbi:MAG: ATP-binding cassette domain-containing protein [Bacteroidota bacterium]